ncbi:MAG: hypothetical protein HY913_18535 [Desulfomonile tiedjei]|nr:hypothetical protein [Desulfomonile tiedjei]
MKLDKTSPDTELSSIPAEFRENYRFLSELINCRDKNDSAAGELEDLVDRRLCRIRGKLNKRQIKLLNDFMNRTKNDDPECFYPPVPAELEAAIRIKKRSIWLPWEAEAIRKIERWREDLCTITRYWAGARVEATELKRLPIIVQTTC